VTVARSTVFRNNVAAIWMNGERTDHQSLIARRPVDWVTAAPLKWRPESPPVRQCQPAQWRRLKHGGRGVSQCGAAVTATWQAEGGERKGSAKWRERARTKKEMNKEKYLNKARMS
jgi:hypothetical protein